MSRYGLMVAALALSGSLLAGCTSAEKGTEVTETFTLDSAFGRGQYTRVVRSPSTAPSNRPSAVGNDGNPIRGD